MLVHARTLQACFGLAPSAPSQVAYPVSSARQLSISFSRAGGEQSALAVAAKLLVLFRAGAAKDARGLECDVGACHEAVRGRPGRS